MAYKEGDIIEVKIGEHTFRTPPVPKHKEILFHDRPKKDQYWTRQTDLRKIFYDWYNEDHNIGGSVEEDADATRYSEDGTLLSLSVEDTTYLFGDKEKDGVEGMRNREHRRCTEGVWFYNNGEPTYITGNYYFILQWGAMLGCTNSVEPGSSYGQYYQFQRDMCYYFEICKTTESGRGGLFMKPKKTGATQVFSLVCLNEARISRQKNVRMMSITEVLAKESNFGYIKYAMQKLPNIMMPSRSKQNEGEVIFGPPNYSRNALKKRKKSDIEYLNTWLCTVPTTKTAFDSFTNHIALIDEWPKIEENTYPKELFQTTIETVMEGFMRKGTIFALSYSPEKSNRSFREARVIYKGAKLKTRQVDPETNEPYGQTESKLICHTLTVQEGMFNCCDVYGKPIEAKIWATINEELKAAKNDPLKTQSIKRQYPTNENDPWQEGNMEDTLFDNFRITQKMIQLEEDSARGVLPYIDFNLEYQTAPVKRKTGTEYDFSGEIIMKPVTDDQKRAGKPHGLYKWYNKDWTPEWFMTQHVNKLSRNKKTGLLQPNENSPFFISVDPTNYRSKKYTGVGSMNAMLAFILPNPELDAAVGDVVSNKRVFIEYFYRQESPNETLHDIIKLMLWLGCMVQIEGNMSTWTETLIEMGLGHFLLMLNEETGALEPWSPIRRQKLFTSQKQTIEWYVNDGKIHLAEPGLGQHIDNIQYINSWDILSQLASIKMEDTKEYDLAVAYLEGIMGINALMGWKRQQAEKNMRRGDGSIRAAAFGLVR